MTAPKGLLFGQFVTQFEHNFSFFSGIPFISFQNICEASIVISSEVNRAGLGEVLGKQGVENIQGEEVMKLDVLANDLLINSLKKGGQCCAIASEEEDSIMIFDDNTSKKAPYMVLFDPLDGSSNIDTNASIGTIFSIIKRNNSDAISEEDFFQKGRDIVGAGYVLYGSSTMMVYSVGNGVHGFTLDQKTNEFHLSHFDIKTPKMANQFSINYGLHESFDQRTKSFVSWCTEDNIKEKKPFSIRYIGSMVADFHRNLLKGGIFIYPSSPKSPKGKLRLLYECIPLSYIQECAGGLSTDNHQSILDIEPTELHQRTPIVLGSSDLVVKYLSL